MGGFGPTERKPHNLELFGIIWDQLGAFGTISDHLGGFLDAAWLDGWMQPGVDAARFAGGAAGGTGGTGDCLGL